MKDLTKLLDLIELIALGIRKIKEFFRDTEKDKKNGGQHDEKTNEEEQIKEIVLKDGFTYSC